MKIVKPILLVFTATLLVLVSQLSHSRHAALLIDASNGDVVYELEANQAWYPASLTKLMTLYMAFSALETGRLRLSDQLNVSSHAAQQPTSKLGLRAWSSISAEDAILAVITRSANDAAVVLGERLGGTEDNFAIKMTSTAHSLGMYGSHFMNATGLPHDWQTTTARDMAMLAYRIIHDFPQYYPYFAVDSAYINGRQLPSTNKFVANYPGAEGMKTGYTCGSGYNLVATANLYGKRLIGVVLGGHTSYERYQYMFTMMDIGFGNERGSYRSQNINTMNKNAVGTPPYQLSCGHRPSSHYATRAIDEDDDDKHIRYVKKARSAHPRHIAATNHRVEIPREITKVRIAGKTKTIVKTQSQSKYHGKTIVVSKAESTKGSKTKSKKAIEPVVTKSKAKAGKSVQVAKATAHSKGYFVPGAKNKSKTYYKPTSSSKTALKTTTSTKKSSKKKT